MWIKIKQRLKSKTIWLTSIAPSIFAFLTTYSTQMQDMLQDHYQSVFVVFAALAWYSRETTNKSLNDK